MLAKVLLEARKASEKFQRKFIFYSHFPETIVDFFVDSRLIYTSNLKSPCGNCKTGVSRIFGGSVKTQCKIARDWTCKWVISVHNLRETTLSSRNFNTRNAKIDSNVVNWKHIK
jgi:hypothetical protein